MENYFGLLEAAFALIVLIGIGVVEFVARRMDKKSRRDKDTSEKP